jgi:ABC-type branched-subunit amino acid transport system substrate-binding protein
MNKRFLRLLALLLAFGLVAVACGSDDNKDSATDTGGGSTTTAAAADSGDIHDIVKNDPLSGAEATGLDRGVSDDSVTIGCVQDAKSYAGFEDGVKARFARANAEGGVNGRTIDFLGCENDGADQQQFLSLTKQIVQQDEAFGMITIEGVIPQAAFDFMNQQQVPYTGWGFLAGFCGTRWGFGWNGCLSGNTLKDAVPHAVEQANLGEAVIAAIGKPASELKVAIQGQDTESAKISEKQYVDTFEHAGATVVYTARDIPVPGPTSDYTPFVQKVLAKDPNLVLVSTSFGDVGGFTAALKAAGYKGDIMNFVAYIPGLLDASKQLAQAIEGSYINTQIVPQEQQTDWVKQMETDLESSKAATGKFITFGGALGYAQANLWVAMLEAAGKDLDTKTFDAAVNGKGLTVDTASEGGIGDVSFPAQHFLPTDCAAIVKVEGGKFVVAKEYDCYDSIPVK